MNQVNVRIKIRDYIEEKCKKCSKENTLTTFTKRELYQALDMETPNKAFNTAWAIDLEHFLFMIRN